MWHAVSTLVMHFEGIQLLWDIQAVHVFHRELSRCSEEHFLTYKVVTDSLWILQKQSQSMWICSVEMKLHRTMKKSDLLALYFLRSTVWDNFSAFCWLLSTDDWRRICGQADPGGGEGDHVGNLGKCIITSLLASWALLLRFPLVGSHFDWHTSPPGYGWVGAVRGYESNLLQRSTSSHRLLR